MERRNRTLQELTIKDNFMFAAVMLDPENARLVLERILQMEIRKVEVLAEKSIVYNPEYKGVRLDVYAKDENNTHFNVEMQAASRPVLRRARYYHDQIDMELLATGLDYEELPDTYVIFICDYDPIGLGKYKYTRKTVLEEDGNFRFEDGTHTVFLNTKGNNHEEVPKELITFLNYVSADLSASQKEYDDELVTRLQNSVKKIKLDREMGRCYMLLEEIKKEEYRAGKAEGRLEGELKGKQDAILELFSEFAPIDQRLENRIRSVRNLDDLKELLRKAATAGSSEEFIAELDHIQNQTK